MTFGQDVLPVVRPYAPQQPSAELCGVYVIRYAKASSKERWHTTLLVTTAELPSKWERIQPQKFRIRYSVSAVVLSKTGGSREVP